MYEVTMIKQVDYDIDSYSWKHTITLPFIPYVGLRIAYLKSIISVFGVEKVTWNCAENRFYVYEKNTELPSYNAFIQIKKTIENEGVWECIT